MGLTRRMVLTLAGVVGLTGCSTSPAKTPPEGNPEHTRTNRGRHFNENGELVSEVNNELVSTGQAEIGEGTSYPFVTNEKTTVTVPGDYQTIQAAVDAAPKHLRHEYLIDVSDGHSEGHLIIRGHTQEGSSTDNAEMGGAGQNYQLQIRGSSDDPSQVTIDSLSIIGCSGVETPQIWGVEFTGRDNPDWDESVCVNASGTTEAFVADSNFRNPNNEATRAVQAYTSGMHLRRCDFGTDEFATGVFVKRMSTVVLNDCTGSATSEAAYFRQLGTVSEQGTTLDGGYTFEEGGELRKEDGTVMHGAGEVSYGSGTGSGASGLHYTNQGNSQSISGGGSWNTVEYGTQVRDDNGEWDTSSNQFTASSDGIYEITYSVHLTDVPANATYKSRIEGAIRTGADFLIPESQKSVRLGNSGTVELESGDTLQIEAKQDSGESVSASDYVAETYLQINKLG